MRTVPAAAQHRRRFPGDEILGPADFTCGQQFREGPRRRLRMTWSREHQQMCQLAIVASATDSGNTGTLTSTLMNITACFCISVQTTLKIRISEFTSCQMQGAVLKA